MKKNCWKTVIMMGVCFVLAGLSAHCAEASVNEQSSFTRQVCAARSTNIGGLAASDGRSTAAGVEGIPLKLRKDITKYDVTGDGITDLVRIESEKPIKKYGPYDSPWIITINGTRAFRSNPNHYVEFLTVVLYPISDDKIYFNIMEEVGSNDDINTCAFYQYQSGKLKKVCDVFSLMTQHKSQLHPGVMSMQVNENEIKVSYYNQFSVTGHLEWSAVFRQENGVWKVDGNIYSTVRKKSLTANRKITLYKKPGGTGKALTMAKGQKVKVDKICLKNKKAYIHIVLPNGKNGWMESSGKHYIDGYYFREVQFAG